MTVYDLSSVNAVLNALSAILLIRGYLYIKAGKREQHKKAMLSATFVSVAFLISYVIYHYNVGSVPYPHHDWTRTLYFLILIPHVILAGINAPFIALLLILALKEKFPLHKKWAHFVYPVWIYVSVSGVVIYLMLYHL
ncbi:MAG: DUF420 domain-containing protein [Calditrichaeota bacterium]|nr:MAG: DUF420 domain-containing protein [Calditrichota bacterium]